MKRAPRLLRVAYPPRYCPSHLNLYHFQSLRRPTMINKYASNVPTLNPGTRHASTAAGDAVSFVTRLKNFMFGTSIILSGVFIYYYITDVRAGFHRWIVVPGLRYFYEDAEDAHHFANQSLRALYQFGIHPRERGNPDSTGDLQIEVFGETLHNPIATSAGIDKHADIPDPLFAMGPSIIEIGGCTPLPQSGNPSPRVFRLPSQNAIINRYGLNSEGADHVAMRLRHRVREFAKGLGYGIDEAAEKRVLNGEAGVPPGSLKPGKLMAVQVAKNKFTPDNDIKAVTADYIYCVEALAPYADIIVVNVSSPNTPGLRDLQASAPLTSILTGVVKAAKSVDRKTKPAVMVKVSPDEDTDEQVMGICEAVWESGVDGVIVGNTTKSRPESIPSGYSLPPKEMQLLLEQGGFSGPHLFQQTVNLVKKYRGPLNSRPPPKSDASTTSRSGTQSADTPKIIFATGGITSGKQAQEVLDAGAQVAMLYTALVYGGIGTIGRIKDELREERKKRTPKVTPKTETKVEGTKKVVTKGKEIKGKAEAKGKEIKKEVEIKGKEIKKEVETNGKEIKEKIKERLPTLSP